MLIAGKKTSVLKSETATNIACPSCKKVNTTKIKVMGTYKHLLQIPFLSGEKFGKSACLNCKNSYENNTMPATIKLAYFEIKENVRTPIWYYSGLIVLKTLVLIKIFNKYL